MLQSTDKLKLEINKIIKNEFDNVELKKSLNQSFASKNLNLKTIPLLFDEKKFVEQLNDFELIAFCKGAYNIFKNNKALNPNNYFSETMLNSYKNYIFTTEEINTIYLKCVHKLDTNYMYSKVAFKESINDTRYQRGGI